MMDEHRLRQIEERLRRLEREIEIEQDTPWSDRNTKRWIRESHTFVVPAARELAEALRHTHAAEPLRRSDSSLVPRLQEALRLANVLQRRTREARESSIEMTRIYGRGGGCGCLLSVLALG